MTNEDNQYMDLDKMKIAWQREQDARQKQVATDALPVLRTCYQKKVRKIQITYRGSNDSGMIDTDEIEFLSALEKPLSRRGRLSHVDVEAIADLAYEYLPSGWEINDGSEGTITVNISDPKNCVISISHYWLQPTLDESLSDTNFSLED